MTSFNERLRKAMAEKGPEAAKKWAGKLHPSKCPECNHVDNLTEAETKRAVHCQRCYRMYKYQGGR